MGVLSTLAAATNLDELRELMAVPLLARGQKLAGEGVRSVRRLQVLLLQRDASAAAAEADAALIDGHVAANVGDSTTAGSQTILRRGRAVSPAPWQPVQKSS